MNNIMNPALITLSSLALLSSSVCAQTVTSSDASFGFLIDSFEGDEVGSLTTGFTTARGNTINFTTDSTESIFTNGALFGQRFPDGTQAWALTALPTAATFHQSEIVFASAVEGFGFDLVDFGDGVGFSTILITASDGTVLLDHDEEVDGDGRVVGNRFYGISGGSFTGFTIVSTSAGLDNFAIDHIVSTEALVLPGSATIPEPSSVVLLGIGALGLFTRRRGSDFS